MTYKFWVYIMASRSGTLYIGFTDELENSCQNSTNRAKSKAFFPNITAQGLFTTSLSTMSKKRLAARNNSKAGDVRKRVALIEKVNPRWEDLAEKWGAKMRFAGQALS